MSAITRRLPVGADLQSNGSTHFRVWAPAPREVTLVLYSADAGERDVAMTREQGGYYSVEVPLAGAGTRYRYRLDGDTFADPASRFQPEGVFGPSEVVDATRFRWHDAAWRGVSLPGQVVYEMHVGTFTREGTWQAAIERLPLLAETGISLIELMPLAEFPGQFGWGYDGVFPYAPTHLYGTPDDFRAFVDRAHALRIGVILDVVYNHLGPEGSVFRAYAPQYFSTRYQGEWGDPLNFDDADSGPVREFFGRNGSYWIETFHLDGLRLDATQGVHDASAENILAVIGRDARAAAAGRSIVLIAENEPQQTRLVRPISQGGYGLDALWNDDFHHSAFVAATGRREAYYSDQCGSAQELVSAAKRGFLFQGQRYAWQKGPRGSSSRGLPPSAFVTYLENHDQLANSGDGSRLRHNTAPGTYRALSALFLLMPGTPMLFQGQEFGASTPFLYFADLSPELAQAVQRGRAEFVSQFASLAAPEMQARLAPPHDPDTFARCKLDWEGRDPQVAQLYRDLIALRRRDAAFRLQAEGALDGAVLGQQLFMLRFFTPNPVDERLLLVNLGADHVVTSIPDPLAAPPDGLVWRTEWSSESPAYGGLGTPTVVHDEGWYITGHAAIVLEAANGGHRSS
jgi:maltooligosyltrehalose trehalohydrolase